MITRILLVMILLEVILTVRAFYCKTFWTIPESLGAEALVEYQKSKLAN